MFLPYHCPVFRTDHLLEPCTKNLTRVKYLRLAKKHVGALEQCVGCRGKMLIAKPRTVIEGLPAPENWVEERFVVADPKDPFKPYRQDWNPNPEVTAAPLFLNDVGKKEPMSHEDDAIVNLVSKSRVLSPEKIATTRKVVQRMAERYKKEMKRAELPQLSPEKEETYHRIMEKQEEIVPVVKITEKEAIKMGIVSSPESGAENRQLGRWMGMCAECVSIRGRECGIQNAERGVTAPPMAIPLNLPKYAELKAWLIEEAEQDERKLIQQVMFILKMAWKQGT